MGRRKYHNNYDYFQIIGPNGLEDVVKEPPKPKIKPKYTYTYSGSVKRYGKIVIDDFYAITEAVSEKKAKQNIIFRAKMKLGLLKSAGGIELTNSVVQK